MSQRHRHKSARMLVHRHDGRMPCSARNKKARGVADAVAKSGGAAARWLYHVPARGRGGGQSGLAGERSGL
eukprot:7991058-Alexandrium_andersonii.AAC.1